MDSELSTSSDEADAAAVVGAGTSADPEAYSDHETPKEIDTLSSLVADPEGVPVSVRSSLDEANCVAMSGIRTSNDPKAFSDHETPKEPNTPSSCVADPEGVPVSMRSSSD